MKSNKEILRESFKRVLSGKWFWRILIVSTLLGTVNNFANKLIADIFAKYEIQTWLRLTPHCVLFKGSDPIATFVVSACSERCRNVPLIWKFLLKSYSQLTPNMVLRDCP